MNHIMRKPLFYHMQKPKLQLNLHVLFKGYNLGWFEWSIFCIFEAKIISSPEPKAHGDLIVYQSSCRLCVCLCVHTFKH